MHQQEPPNITTPPEILPPEDSSFWRSAYIEAFIDTSTNFYNQHIATLRQFSDGLHHEGYLWDCLRSSTRITFERLQHEVMRYTTILVMADNHSRDRIPGAPLWPYRTESIARFTPQALLANLHQLPQDLYIFDESLAWTLILTHEHDTRRHLCVAIGIQK